MKLVWRPSLIIGAGKVHAVDRCVVAALIEMNINKKLTSVPHCDDSALLSVCRPGLLSFLVTSERQKLRDIAPEALPREGANVISRQRELSGRDRNWT